MQSTLPAPRSVIFNGARSPMSSLTRSLASTLDCCHGLKGPGARLVEFDDAGFSPTACAKEVR